MDLSLKVKIKKRTVPEWLILWIIALPLVWGTLFDLFSLPGIMKYTADVAWVCLLVVMLFRKTGKLQKKVFPIILLVVVLFAYSLILYLFNFQSIFYFLWGVRNNFRYFVFFFAIIMFIDEDDVDQFFKVLDVLFWINAVVSLIQYFVFGYEQDYLGGIFGVTSGCNASTIIFFLIVISKSLLNYMEKKEDFKLCFAKSAVSIFIAALAELKFYFVAFLLLLVLATVLTSFSWRKLSILLICSVLAIFGSTILAVLFDDDFLTLENIWKLATQEHYSTQKTVNRLSAIPTLAKLVVTEFKDRLFGLGLGNCDTSSFAICNTPFYQGYGYLRYTFFSCAFLFLEVGYVGLLMFVSFFIFCFFMAKKELNAENGNRLYAQMAMIMAVFAVILVFYNSSLRAEAGYMVYFILALPFIEKLRKRELKNQ